MRDVKAYRVQTGDMVCSRTVAPFIVSRTHQSGAVVKVWGTGLGMDHALTMDAREVVTVVRGW